MRPFELSRGVLRLTIAMLFGLCATTSWASVAQDMDPEAPGLSAGERLEILVDRVETRRAELTSLKASFRERKESPLLLAAEEATGTFLFAAPDRARWNLRGTTDTKSAEGDGVDELGTVIVVRDGEMTTWYRHLGTAERVRLGSQGERLLQFFGPGSSLQELRRYFDLRFTRSGDPEIPYRLELMPRSRRVARRVRHLTLDIDRQLFLPTHVRFEEASGAVTEYWFSDMESNVDIPDDAFDLKLPADVEVREVALGASGRGR